MDFEFTDEQELFAESIRRLRRTRGWMIAGGSVEILKNRIAEHVFDRRFDQRPRHADAAQ